MKSIIIAMQGADLENVVKRLLGHYNGIPEVPYHCVPLNIPAKTEHCQVTHDATFNSVLFISQFPGQSLLKSCFTCVAVPCKNVSLRFILVILAIGE